MIEFQAVSKTYGAGLPVLKEISLAIGSGEVVFIAGPSGAGKTTLLKLAIRDEEPSAGRIRVDGQNIAGLGSRGVLALRRRIGVVLQQLRLLPGLTALENVALAAELAGAGQKFSRGKAERLLDQLGLYERREAVAATLSSGEQQRVAIARALINEPALILADEPTGSLDTDTAHEIMRRLLQARERGATVVVATHDGSVANRYADRVLSLCRGELIEEPYRVQAIGAGA